MTPAERWVSISTTFLARLVEDAGLRRGNNHVLDADRNSGAGGEGEGDLLHVVEHLHRQVVAVLDVAIADQVLQAALLEQAVDERDLRRQRAVEDHAADCALDQLVLDVVDLGVQHVLASRTGSRG
jgi:hypothetical protein